MRLFFFLEINFLFSLKGKNKTKVLVNGWRKKCLQNVVQRDDVFDKQEEKKADVTFLRSF